MPPSTAQHLSGDIGGLVRGKEGHRPGHILRLPPDGPWGWWPAVASWAASGMAAVISVAMKPGATALTVTPREASSLARDLVMPMRPALLAA